MRYSLIKPTLKPILNLFTKVWLVLILFMTFCLLTFDLYLKTKIYKYSTGINTYKSLIISNQKNIKAIDTQTQDLFSQSKSAENIYASNMILKESIKNLFDLVPEQITLSKVIMDKNKLILHGVTPSKDVFNFLMLPPLKSIFNTSNTIFYLNKNGWYKFVSENTINDSEGFNE